MEEDSGLFNISISPEAGSVGVPIYNVDLVYDLNSNRNSDDEDKPKRAKISKNSCWNCGDDDHSLRQCKHPFDSKKVNQNRTKFMARGFNEFKRYHVDGKQKAYPHLIPGAISNKLRESLGLRNDQLPPYIYKMRSLGYPPGWLLHAKSEYSGIEMFGIDGNRIPNADEEEGEIGFPGERVSYDESKVVTYPGFNSWPEPGVRDETSKYGAPELSFVQSKEEFIKYLKNLSTPIDQHKILAKTVTSGSDMEAEETGEINLLPDDDRCAFIPPLPDECLPPPPPPPSDNLIEKKTDDIDKVGSSTIGNVSTEQKESPVAILNRTIETPESTHGKTKSIAFGTPVLKIHSSYCKLPPPEAFQKNISDVINFENLPDSTGSYEKLKGVLKHARSKMSSLRENKMNNTF